MMLAGLIQQEKCGYTWVMSAGLMALFSPVPIWQVARSAKDDIPVENSWEGTDIRIIALKSIIWSTFKMSRITRESTPIGPHRGGMGPPPTAKSVWKTLPCYLYLNLRCN